MSTLSPRIRPATRGKRHTGSGLSSYCVPLPPSIRERLASLLERYTYAALCAESGMGQRSLRKAIDGDAVTHETAARILSLLERVEGEELDELDMPSWYR